MKPEDLGTFRVPGTPTVSPDGRNAIVAVSRPDLKTDEYHSQLWIVPTDGSVPARPFTHGAKDSEPTYSPDGRWIAFLRAGEGKGAVSRPQMHVIPSDGGDARRLTEHHLGASSPVWSPDSARIAYTTRVPEEGRYGTDEDISADAEAPRLITKFGYRADGAGFVLDRPSKVFVVDVPDSMSDERPEPVQVTSGDQDDTSVAWSPDGALLAFVSDRRDNGDLDLVTDVYVCSPDGSGLRRVTDSSQSLGNPVFTADAARIVFAGWGDMGPERTDFVAHCTGVFAVPADGSQPPVRLTDPETVNTEGRLVVDGDAVVVAAAHRGAEPLLRIPLDAAEPVTLDAAPKLFDGKGGATGYDVSADGSTVVATVTDAGSFGELAVLRDGEPTVLTAFGAELTERGGLRPPEELVATSGDGYPVHGWIFRPEGEGPHPVLFTIHGGPFAQYGWSLFDEAQVYVSAGYAVVMCNPRGSNGYGGAHGRAIWQAVGTVDADDLLAFLDAALTAPDLDAERVGVMGGSYGGLMTTWLVGHTDRFTAAISERALNAFDSFAGSSDIGWFFTAGYTGGRPDQVATQSPFSYADKIQTPTMVIHSEQDWRCPVEQGQRLWVALKRNGVETEFLLFPGEGHELSRSGRPKHRLARFEHILRWWARYLPTSQNPRPEPKSEPVEGGE